MSTDGVRGSGRSARTDYGHVSTAAGRARTGGQPREDSAAGPGATSAPDAVPRFVETSGGTGLNRLDRTPQVAAAVLDYQMPGVMQTLWAAGLQSTPTAVMSRGVASVRGFTFAVNLLGSAGGVRDGTSVLTPILPHIQDQVEDCGGASPVSLR